jgi:hypothetical protein
VLIAIAKRRLRLPHSPHEVFQSMRMSLIEKTPMNQQLLPPESDKSPESEPDQPSPLKNVGTQVLRNNLL